MDGKPQFYWQTREAKNKERPAQETLHNWQAESDAYNTDPAAYRKKQEDRSQEAACRIEAGLQAGLIEFASASKDTRIQELQKIIDRMVDESRQFKIYPELVIHGDASWNYDEARGINARVGAPGIIETDSNAVRFFLEHPDAYKALIAHEMAHILNDDVSVESKMSTRTAPLDQKMEILADRMGAIIHGNPAQYAQAHAKLWSAGQAENSHIFSKQYLSANGRARMLHKWADILQREGATDKDGNIVDKNKAMEIYARSQDLTDALAKFDRDFSR